MAELRSLRPRTLKQRLTGWFKPQLLIPECTDTIVRQALDDVLRVALAENEEVKRREDEANQKPVFSKQLEWPS